MFYQVFHFSRLILIADKYNFAGLVSLCQTSLAKNLNLDNALDVTSVAFKIDQAQKLRSICIKYIASNLKSLMKAPNWETAIGSNSKLLQAILLEKC